MRNATGGCCERVVLQRVLGASPASAPCHGYAGGQLATSAATCREELMRVPDLFHAIVSLNVFLLGAYLLLFILVKIVACLQLRATSNNSKRDHGGDHRSAEISEREDEEYYGVGADIAGGGRNASTLFWFDEAVLQDSALLSDEGKDHLYNTGAAHCLQVESTFPTVESAHISAQYNRATSTGHDEEEAMDVAAADAPTVPDQLDIPAAVASPEKENVPIEEGTDKGSTGDEEEDEGFAGEEVKLFVNSRALADTKKLLLEGVAGGGRRGGGGDQHCRHEMMEEDKDSFRLGASTLTSESTSKSSVEWQSSTVTKDSETEYPFSSSSRRSSARWESYTLFRKYDEDMVYFHRVGAQKLTETESFRSIKYQPRSVSERIVQKLAPKPKPSTAIELRDPYPELEKVYVAQICLTWEALSWNYASFRRHGDDIASRCCPARVAQEFQQFQVLLHRFIENEPYEYGRRPEIYARMKNSSPKLLLVPEFREEDDEKDDLISAVQFLHILEESIRIFMTFLRNDKRSHYQMFREMVKRRTSASDQTLVITLKKANKKKKSGLKDLTRPRRCLKRTKVREQEEVSFLLGLIDLKVVARVLRMPEITDQQLHWCEEKMSRIRVDPAQGKMHRDPSPLFFPAH